MRLLDRHIGRHILGGTLVAIFALGALDIFFAVMNELDDVGRGGYGLAQVLAWVGLTIPRRLYELFPTAMLLGTLLSLGTLAANSELIAMRAAGVSLANIIRSALKAGVVIMVFAVLVGELVAPETESRAQAVKAGLSGERMVFRDGALWIRDGRRFVRVSAIHPDRRLIGVEVYEVGEGQRLVTAVRADSSVWDGQAWLMQGIERSRFTEEGVVVESLVEERWTDLLAPDLFEVLAVEPRQMSAWALSRYILYLRSNALDASSFELAFWTRITTPLSGLVMLLLALPFVFGPLRSGGVGQRLFVGILVGIGFFLVSRIFNHVGLVYGLSPLASAFAPLLIFLAVSLTAIRRLR